MHLASCMMVHHLGTVAHLLLSSVPPPFRVLPEIAGRAPSTQFVSWVRPADAPTAAWVRAPVLQTTAVATGDKPTRALGACGYFGHLSNWSASWLTFELGAPLDVRVRRVDGKPIRVAAVHPASSGASATVIAGDAILSVPAQSRFAVDFDGTMDRTDTGPSYSGAPIHTFSVFANELDPNPPKAGDVGVTAIAPGDPLPTKVAPNTTVLFLPGEHRTRSASAAQAQGEWARFTLPPDVRVHFAIGAILYAALDTGGVWGAKNITVDGFGIISGEEMRRCPNRTNVSMACSDACPTNISPQGITLTGVTRARISGVTFIDFPQHHLIMQSTDCAAFAGGYSGIADNLKVIGWRANGDGLHVFGSWRVSRLFMRTQDDSMYLSSGARRVDPYLPLHFKRILLTILTCPPHILTFENSRRVDPSCGNTQYSEVTTWNDANGASFCFGSAYDNTLSNSDVIYARTSYDWWSGGRVFSGRGSWLGSNITISDVRLSDPLPSMNWMQISSDAEEGFAYIRFQNVTVASEANTARACTSTGGCNCQPACPKGEQLPQGMPNLLAAKVHNLSFSHVTVGGKSIAEVLFSPSFNITKQTVSDVYVDGRRVL